MIREGGGWKMVNWNGCDFFSLNYIGLIFWIILSSILNRELSSLEFVAFRFIIRC